jgi:hypothetical protein
VDKRGAAGFITDFVMEPENHHDVLRYTSFWWEPGQKKAFGFVLPPREGDRFAELCADLAKKGKRPLVKAYVESSIYDGEIENVTAFLPGEIDEEILLVGHGASAGAATRYLKEKANFTGNCGISFNAAVCTFEVSADGSVKLLEPWNCNHIPLEKVTSNKRSYEEVMAEV